MPEPIISFQWNNDHDSLKIGVDHLYLRHKKKFHQFQFSEIISAELSTKKKLAPLVSGAILASLVMVNILLAGPSVYMVGLFSLGMLIFYLGLTDYWVINISHPTESVQLWISKNKTPDFPEVILSVTNFRIKQGYFPFLYCEVGKEQINQYLQHNDENPEQAHPLYTLLPPKQRQEFIILKIDASRLSRQIYFHEEPGILAYGNYKINKEALVGIVN